VSANKRVGVGLFELRCLPAPSEPFQQRPEVAMSESQTHRPYIMSKLLRDAGEALYGPRWQTELARDLQTSEHVIGQWVSGADDVPRKIELALLRLCMERANAIDGILRRLKHVATPIGVRLDADEFLAQLRRHTSSPN